MPTADHDPTLSRLTEWARSRPDVHLVLLTSNRAVPGGKVDAYSDYDVVLAVDDVEAMIGSTAWIHTFGDVVIAYWDPVSTDAATGAVTVSSIVNYANGLKIDFSLWSMQHLDAVVSAPRLIDELDAGYRVLLDKQGHTDDLAPPTYAAYIPRRPDEATYLRLITDFFIGAPYVAKGLLRGQLLPTKWVLDFDMRFTYVVPMLEWRMECDHDWTVKPGNLGKGLERQLDPERWEAFESTFAGADEQDNWRALFAMIEQFGQVGREVAESLGYTYPQDLHDRVTAHVEKMRAGVFADGPLDPPVSPPD